MKVFTMGLLALCVSGCASFNATEDDLMRFNGNGPDVCAWGGRTPASNAHCQKIRWGEQGQLRAINQHVNEALATVDGNCLQHAHAVLNALREQTRLSAKAVYSCPSFMEECHVSVEVTASDGEHYVLDNGAALSPGVYLDSVATLAEFTRQVESASYDPFSINGRRHIAARP